MLGLEFFYGQAPTTLKSLIMSFFYCGIAIGSYLGVISTYFTCVSCDVLKTSPLQLGSALVELVNINPENEWIGDDLNKSHLDYYFFLLGGIRCF
jgi:hypothetical protein